MQVAAWIFAEQLSMHDMAWPLHVLLILTAGALAVVVWVFLYQFAKRSGGTWYALGQTLLAVALTPAAYIGVIAIPLLVERDVRSGHARWRQRTAPPLGERLLWAGMFLIAAVTCTALWGPVGPIAAIALTLVTWKLLGQGQRAES